MFFAHLNLASDLGDKLLKVLFVHVGSSINSPQIIQRQQNGSLLWWRSLIDGPTQRRIFHMAFVSVFQYA